MKKFDMSSKKTSFSVSNNSSKQEALKRSQTLRIPATCYSEELFVKTADVKTFSIFQLHVKTLGNNIKRKQTIQGTQTIL